MKHTQVIQLFHNLSKVKGLEGRQVTYIVKKNLVALAEEIKIYQEEEKEIQEIISEFEEKKQEILKKYTGELGKEVSKKQMPDFEKDVKKLAETAPHKADIKKYEEKWEALIKHRTEKESKFKIIKVALSEVPEKISDENMNLIFELIE